MEQFAVVGQQVMKGELIGWTTPAIRFVPKNSKLWQFFFLTPLIFGDGPKISKSVDFEQQ